MPSIGSVASWNLLGSVLFDQTDRVELSCCRLGFYNRRWIRLAGDIQDEVSRLIVRGDSNEEYFIKVFPRAAPVAGVSLPSGSRTVNVCVIERSRENAQNKVLALGLPLPTLVHGRLGSYEVIWRLDRLISVERAVAMRSQIFQLVYPTLAIADCDVKPADIDPELPLFGHKSPYVSQLAIPSNPVARLLPVREFEESIDLALKQQGVSGSRA